MLKLQRTILSPGQTDQTFHLTFLKQMFDEMLGLFGHLVWSSKINKALFANQFVILRCRRRTSGENLTKMEWAYNAATIHLRKIFLIEYI